MKSYKRFLIDMKLMEDVAFSDKESESKINKIYRTKYNELFLNNELMKTVVGDESLNEDLNDVILKISSGDFIKDEKKFHNSYVRSKKIRFLTPYRIEDLKDFDLYKLNGYNIGFAIKKDGEITLVHNCEDSIKGIGKKLIDKATQFGGVKLDHFDGYLTKFYRECGFEFKSNDFFCNEHAPKKWLYEKVDITNPNESIYANEHKVNIVLFNKAKERYDGGKPDIVYRLKR